MYYTDDSILPENMAPLIITAAPLRPGVAARRRRHPPDLGRAGSGRGGLLQRRRHDAARACARSRHRPWLGRTSTQFNYFIGRLKQAVPKMIMQVGGSISFAPQIGRREGEMARLRHPAHAHRAGSEAGIRDDRDRHDAMGHHVDVFCRTTSRARISRTTRRSRRRGPACGWTPAPPSTSSISSACAKTASSPISCLATSISSRLIERLIRAGVYMGPLNLAIAGYGGGTLGRNPFDWMEFLRRVPQGVGRYVLVQHEGTDLALRDGDRARPACARRQRGQSVGPDKKRRTTVQQIEGAVRICRGVRPQGRDRGRGAQDHEGRRLVRQCRGDAAQSRSAAEPHGRPTRASSSGRPTARRRPQRSPATRIRWPTAWCHRRQWAAQAKLIARGSRCA